MNRIKLVNDIGSVLGKIRRMIVFSKTPPKTKHTHIKKNKSVQGIISLK